MSRVYNVTAMFAQLCVCPSLCTFTIQTNMDLQCFAFKTLTNNYLLVSIKMMCNRSFFFHAGSCVYITKRIVLCTLHKLKNGNTNKKKKIRRRDGGPVQNVHVRVCLCLKVMGLYRSVEPF